MGPVGPVEVRQLASTDRAAPEGVPLFKRPGFGCGIGAGVLAALALVIAIAAVNMVSTLLWWRGPAVSDSSSKITISPVSAGEEWFTIGRDGTGTLEGWSNGEMSWGEGYGGDEPDHTFGVFEVGAVGDLPIRHVVTIALDRDTDFYVGSDEYRPASGKAPLEELFGDDGSGGMFCDGITRLKIEFERRGDWLYATKVTADPNGPEAPDFYY